MKISTKGRYAIQTLVDLAQHEEGLVPLKDVAARQGVSQKYLEQIVMAMSKAGFLYSVRGPQGGYKLARQPEEYNMAEVLQTIEGSLAPVVCLDTDTNTCEKCDTCATVDMWSGLYKAMTDYLSGVTLRDLVDRANRSGGKVEL